jgi:integrase
VADDTGGLRRGWREKVEPGLYRTHRVACDSSANQKPGRRCGCPFQVKVPGLSPGSTRMVTVAGSITQARTERRRLMAEGRPALPAEPAWSGTLDEFTRSYFQAKAPVLAASTVRGRDEAYRHKISPALGALDVTAVTRERVEVWLAELAANDSHHAVWKAVSALRAILKVAVEWGVIPTNPATGLRLPKPDVDAESAPERVLNEQQLAALFEAASTNARLETMFRMAGEAGLRRGEILGLRWPDLDLAARRVTVARAVWQERGRGGAAPTSIVKAPKSGKARRVAISQTLATRLADWYAESVIESGASATGYVWPGRNGGAMDSSTPAQALLRVLDRVGLVSNPKPRRKGEYPRGLVTLHGLRHTAASVMLARGVALIVVSRQLGHANPNITATVYAHLVNTDRQLDEAAAVFDRGTAAQVGSGGGPGAVGIVME